MRTHGEYKTVLSELSPARWRSFLEKYAQSEWRVSGYVLPLQCVALQNLHLCISVTLNMLIENPEVQRAVLS